MHLHNIVNNMLHIKRVAKRHSYLVQGVICIIHVKHHTHVVHKYRCSFRDLDYYWSKVASDHNRIINSFLNRCEIGIKMFGVCTVVCSFDDYFVGVDTTTEKKEWSISHCPCRAHVRNPQTHECPINQG